MVLGGMAVPLRIIEGSVSETWTAPSSGKPVREIVVALNYWDIRTCRDEVEPTLLRCLS